MSTEVALPSNRPYLDIDAFIVYTVDDLRNPSKPRFSSSMEVFEGFYRDISGRIEVILMQIRVLLTAMKLDIGGAETHVVELAKSLKNHGVKVFVASNGGVYESALAENGITHFKVPLHNKNVINMIKSYKLLKKIVIENSIDIIHCHARIPSFICGRLHKLLYFRFVTTAHWVFNPNFPFNLLTNWGESTLAVSIDIRDYLVKNYGMDAEKIGITVNGINTDVFSPDADFSDIQSEFGIDKDKKCIVYLSRLDTSRSLVAKHLVGITKELTEAVPDLQILIVGGGDDFNNVKSMSDSVNQTLGRNVIKLAGSRSDDVYKFAAMGTIFVGVSRSALEAMSCERPSVIAGNEGYLGIFSEDSLDTAIESNFTCRGCPKPSPEKLKKDLIYLLTGCAEDRLSALGKYGRQIVKEKYSVDIMTNDVLKLYNDVLSAPDVS